MRLTNENRDSLSVCLKFTMVTILTFLALLPSLSRADVWRAQNHWDDTQDSLFSEWIRQLPMDIFSRKDSPYQGIATDCADAAYTLRTIFAYEHGLPVKFTGSGAQDLSNSNRMFDSEIDPLKRLRKFIRYVNYYTNTQTLVSDSYPVAITRKLIHGGALFLHPESNANSGVPITYRAGHVYYIQDVYENGMVRYFSSTVPVAVRELQPRIDIIFAPLDVTGGFRYWKRPDSEVRPGFNDRDQFTLAGWKKNGYGDADLWWNWSKAVRQRLALREATDEEEFKASVENVEGYITERTRLVNDAWNLYQKKYHGQSCMNAEDYDAFSTPTRDVKIQSELQYLYHWAHHYLNAQGADSSDVGVDRLLTQYRYTVTPGVSIDLAQIWKAFNTDIVLAISEPEHSPAVRWGLEAQGRWPCPQRAHQYVNQTTQEGIDH